MLSRPYRQASGQTREDPCPAPDLPREFSFAVSIATPLPVHPAILPVLGPRRVAQVFRGSRAWAGAYAGRTRPGNPLSATVSLRIWRLGRLSSQAESLASIFCARNVAGLVKRVRQRSELPPNRRSTHAERPGKPGTPAAGARRARRFPWGRKRDRPPIPSQQAAPRRIAAPACPAPPQAGATALGGRPSSRSAAGHRPRTTLHAATDSTAAVRGGEAGLRRRPNPAGPGIRRAALRTVRLLHQSCKARAAAGR